MFSYTYSQTLSDILLSTQEKIINMLYINQNYA